MNFALFDGPNVKNTYYDTLPIKHLVPQIWYHKYGTRTWFTKQRKIWHIKIIFVNIIWVN